MKTTSIGAAFCFAAILCSNTSAQTSNTVPPSGENQSGDDTVALSAFLVTATGSVQPQSRLKSALSITSINPTMIQQSGARGLAELLRAVPSLYFEPSAGEVGGPVISRGVGSGFSLGKYVGVLEDGMPVVSEQAGSFLAGDIYSRNSLWIEGIEGLTGGSSGVFMSNAPLGSVNFISREGTQSLHGEYKLEIGDYGLMRNDAWVAGPLSTNTTFAVGAMYRISDGIRDPGYKADAGGQIAANLRHNFASGNGHIKVSARHLDDRAALYFPLPLTGAPSDPQTIPGGPDINKGATTSQDTRFFTLPDSPMGPISWDQANSTKNKMTAIGGEFEYVISDFLRIQNRLRYASIDRSSTLNAFGTTTSLQSIANTLARNTLVPSSTWNAALGTDGNYRFRLSSPGSGGTVVAASAADAARLNGNGLGNLTGYWVAAAEIEDLQEDIRLISSFNDDRTTFTAAVYMKSYDEKRLWQQNQELVEISPALRRLDVTYLDAVTGAAIGTYTYNGVTQAGTVYRNGTAEAREISPYFNLTHLVGRFSLDAGVRFLNFDYEGSTEGTKNYDLNSYVQTSGIAALSRGVFGNGIYTGARAEMEGENYTAGLNYEVAKNFALFARYSKGPRMPNAGDVVIANGTGDTTPRALEKITQYEAGLKYGGSNLALFLTAFSTEQRDVLANGLVLDQNGNTIQQSFTYGLDVQGVEIEGTWVPVRGLSIDLRGTVQEPKYVSPQRVNVGTTGSPVYVSIDGMQPTRTPKLFGSISASYTFPEWELGRLTVNAAYNHTGSRPGNQQALPDLLTLASFEEVGAGFSFTFKRNLVFRTQVSNLLNGTGITEFDPRLSAGSTVIPPYFNARPLQPRTVVSSLTYRF
ncbi:MAG TPA: TonB-dependent receptor [Opitutaceae bacterium]